MKQMTATELRDLLASGVSPVKIDVREDVELQYGMIDGAIHIPMQSVPGQLNALEKNKNDTIVLICRSGKRSQQIGAFMEEMGFTDIINLAGGMNAWAKDVDPSMTEY
ncbi:MAG: rhodanese-like domain-containing protein [Pseudomonadota bacterium]|nr:rhodanese-like domain-containing protein [Pseudomonadota bacterium]MDO7710632.1 rhodanese-like domain-containing protein [Pseudomonadota bacterium]